MANLRITFIPSESEKKQKIRSSTFLFLSARPGFSRGQVCFPFPFQSETTARNAAPIQEIQVSMQWYFTQKAFFKKMLVAASLFICALSSKNYSVYNEEIIVAICFIGFILVARKSFGKTFQNILDERMKAIQEELQQFLNPNEVVLLESNEQQRFFRRSLEICGTVVESLPMARSAPKCEKTVQAFLCRNLNVKSATLLNATSYRKSSLLEDLVTGFQFSVQERFLPGEKGPLATVELIREGLDVFKKVRIEKK